MFIYLLFSFRVTFNVFLVLLPVPHIVLEAQVEEQFLQPWEILVSDGFWWNGNLIVGQLLQYPTNWLSADQCHSKLISLPVLRNKSNSLQSSCSSLLRLEVVSCLWSAGSKNRLLVISNSMGSLFSSGLVMICWPPFPTCSTLNCCLTRVATPLTGVRWSVVASPVFLDS